MYILLCKSRARAAARDRGAWWAGCPGHGPVCTVRASPWAAACSRLGLCLCWRRGAARRSAAKAGVVVVRAQLQCGWRTPPRRGAATRATPFMRQAVRSTSRHAFVFVHLVGAALRLRRGPADEQTPASKGRTARRPKAPAAPTQVLGGRRRAHRRARRRGSACQGRKHEATLHRAHSRHWPRPWPTTSRTRSRGATHATHPAELRAAGRAVRQCPRQAGQAGQAQTQT